MQRKQPQRQPWLGRKQTETRRQQLDRISKSCFKCGTVIDNPAALSDHEDMCRGPGGES
jgi:hypothetical protein